MEKQYKVETKYMGERGVPGGPTQLLGTEAREVCRVAHVVPVGFQTSMQSLASCDVHRPHSARSMLPFITQLACNIQQNRVSEVTCALQAPARYPDWCVITSWCCWCI